MSSPAEWHRNLRSLGAFKSEFYALGTTQPVIALYELGLAYLSGSSTKTLEFKDVSDLHQVGGSFPTYNSGPDDPITYVVFGAIHWMIRRFRKGKPNGYYLVDKHGHTLAMFSPATIERAEELAHHIDAVPGIRILRKRD
jgi:hypothetical protein